MAVTLTRKGRISAITLSVLFVLLLVTAIQRAAPGSAADPESVASPSSPTSAAQSDDNVDCSAVSCVALTFDDGPSSHTADLLDTLRADGAHATFFVVGMRVQERPDVVARAAAEGHEIGNHTWSHAYLTHLSKADAQFELSRTADLVQATTGARPTLVRPPYEDTNAAVDALIGGPEILWNVDPEDWRIRNTTAIIAAVLAGVEPGSIVLLHDSYDTTVAAVPGIVAALRALGYHFVTVSHLLDSRTLLPGVEYSHR